MVPLQRPDEIQIPNNSWMQTSGFENMCWEQGIPTMITWSYGGKDVAVEGSWDNWKTRFLKIKERIISILDNEYSLHYVNSCLSSLFYLVFQIGFAEIREGLHYYEGTAIWCLPI